MKNKFTSGGQGGEKFGRGHVAAKKAFIHWGGDQKKKENEEKRVR